MLKLSAGSSALNDCVCLPMLLRGHAAGLVKQRMSKEKVCDLGAWRYRVLHRPHEPSPLGREKLHFHVAESAQQTFKCVTVAHTSALFIFNLFTYIQYEHSHVLTPVHTVSILN